MYKKVELKEKGFVGMEQEVAEVWKEKNIIQKNFDMNKGKRYFTFYDGPPTANGMPHAGHIITRVMKDIIQTEFEWIASQTGDKKYLNRFLEENK